MYRLHLSCFYDTFLTFLEPGNSSHPLTLYGREQPGRSTNFLLFLNKQKEIMQVWNDIRARK